MNPMTTVKLIKNVIPAVSIADVGTMIRGNASLRMRVSRTTIETSASVVASAKNVNRTIPMSSETG